MYRLETQPRFTRNNGHSVSAPPLPRNLEAEMCVLGCMMLQAIDDERLCAEHFYSHPNRTLFTVLSDMRGEGMTVDTVTLAHELQRRGLLADVGGTPYLVQIMNAVYETDRLSAFADVVIETWQQREIAIKSDNLRRAALSGRPLSELAEQIASLDAGSDDSVAMTAHELSRRYPSLRTPVVDGLIREGETVNIVSGTKTGKSWFMLDLALAVATGANWLDSFACIPGPVLLIDNELHPETLAHRLRTVADARGVRLDDIGPNLRIECLRGRWQDIRSLANRIGRLKRPPKMVGIDSFYRTLPTGVDENSNSQLTAVQNDLERLPQRTGAALVSVCHTPKGDMSGRSVADLIVGAGSQGRAVDAIVALRPHEEDGCAVLDAAYRSFAPFEPLPLRWTFPVWGPAAELDPGRLATRPTRNEQQQRARDSEADSLILQNATNWHSRSDLAGLTGMGDRRVTRAINRLTNARLLDSDEQTIKGNPCTVYRKSINAK